MLSREVKIEFKICLFSKNRVKFFQDWLRYHGILKRLKSFFIRRNLVNSYHPSRKLSKLDEPDMWDTAGEVRTSSLVMYSGGPLHMDEQRQDDQLEHTYSSSVPIRDGFLKTCRKQRTIRMGGEIRVRDIRADGATWWWKWSKRFIDTKSCIFYTFKNICSFNLVGLVCWVLWHINLCRLFNAKSIFM